MLIRELRKKVLVLKLQALKRIIGNRRITLEIESGPLQGYKWRFNSKSNNEFIFGGWERIMQDIYFKYLKEGDNVFDLGAHQGYLSLIASKIIGSGSVFAFEALPSNFEILAENIEVNNVRNCTLFNLAVSNHEGFVNFTNSEMDVANTYVSTSPAYKRNSFVKVPARTLDDLYTRGEIATPDFIKIDVEGAELDVLSGSQYLLHRFSPTIYLETHNVHNSNVDLKCKELLTSLGYEAMEELPSGFPGLMASYVYKKI